MTFFLSAQNCMGYLIEKRLCQSEIQPIQMIEKSSKNFNLQVQLPSERHLLIKQESQDTTGKSKGDFSLEWRVYQLFQQFPDLSPLRNLVSDAIYFDPACSILVFNYLNDYQDLLDFYTQSSTFPTMLSVDIGIHIGTALATLHRTTFNHPICKVFLADSQDLRIDRVPNFLRNLERISPERLSHITPEGWQFFSLYQLYGTLGEAIAELNTAFHPCCLAHNDLKLDNILFAPSSVRFIDWERWSWGDPLFDLGTIMAHYLRLWLNSLAISSHVDLETTLNSALVPLEQIQPSLVALLQSYHKQFPELFQTRADSLQRIMQYTGLALIDNLQGKVEYKEPFNNTGICILQIAKALLCHPQSSIPTIFGRAMTELFELNYSCV
jgi:Phosphotransferase enzyme family